MFVAALAAFLLAAQTHATPVARDANPVDTARAFLTAYQNMDFKALAATTTPNYHFHDDVFDNLQSKLQSRDTSNVLNVPLDGVQSRAMFDWFISDQPNTNMIIEIADVSAVNATVVTAHYTANYDFDAGFGSKNPVMNPITSTMTISNGLVADQDDVYDLGFPGWAAQGLGPIMGPLLKDSPATLAFMRAAAAVKLMVFMDGPDADNI